MFKGVSLKVRERGFSLAEVIVAAGLSVMLIILVASLIRLTMGFSRYGKSFDVYLNRALSRNSEVISILSSAGSGYKSQLGIVLFATGNNSPFDVLWVANGNLSKDILALSPDAYPLYGIISSATISDSKLTLTLASPYPSSSDIHDRLGVNHFTVESPVLGDTITVIMDSSVNASPTCVVDPTLDTCSGNACPSLSDCLKTISPVPCNTVFSGAPTDQCMLVRTRNTLLLSSRGFTSIGHGLIIYRESGGNVEFVFAGRILGADLTRNQVTLEVNDNYTGISDSAQASNVSPGDRVIPAHLFYPHVSALRNNTGTLLLDGSIFIENLEVFKVGFEWDTDLDGESDLRVFSQPYPPNPTTFLPITKVDLFFGLRTDPDLSYYYPKPNYQVGYSDAFYTRNVLGVARKCRHFTLKLSSFTPAIPSAW